MLTACVYLYQNLKIKNLAIKIVVEADPQRAFKRMIPDGRKLYLLDKHAVNISENIFLAALNCPHTRSIEWIVDRFPGFKLRSFLMETRLRECIRLRFMDMIKIIFKICDSTYFTKYLSRALQTDDLGFIREFINLYGKNINILITIFITSGLDFYTPTLETLELLYEYSTTVQKIGIISQGEFLALNKALSDDNILAAEWIYEKMEYFGFKGGIYKVPLNLLSAAAQNFLKERDFLNIYNL
jgi:hypothetical protein